MAYYPPRPLSRWAMTGAAACLLLWGAGHQSVSHDWRADAIAAMFGGIALALMTVEMGEMGG
jgi:hypothetical protein